MPRPTLPNALYIIAPDTPASLRAGAFAACGATGAEVQIQAAIDALVAGGKGGVVCLAPGIFNTANPIKLYQGIALVGSGMAATQVKLQAGADCDMIQHFGAYSSTGTASAGAAATLTDASKAWTVNAYAGKYVYIYGGTGAGQRRLISSNTATELTVAAWSTQPDNTSLYRINSTQQLFMKVEGMTVYGNQTYNAATTGTATGGTTTTLTKAGAGWTVNKWADRATIEILGGTATPAGEIRRILSNTADTITVDGPFTVAPDATTTFTIGGSGIAMYGQSAYDLMLTDVWTDECAHHGVYCEETWGHVYKNLISEYNGLDGLRTNLNPYNRGTTGAWPLTTGVVPAEGPKMTLCKLVQNGRHGVYIGDYTYDTEIVGCELAGGGTGGYGVYISPSSVGAAISGNRFVSGAGASSGGIYVGSTGNTITGNTIRGGSGGAALLYGIRVAGSSNIIDGNAVNMASGTAISDPDGRNTIQANQSLTTVYRDRVRGRKSLEKGAGEYVTINPQLGSAGHRAGCMITPIVIPADAYTESAGTWSIAADPAPTASAVRINCDAALSTFATTSAATITLNASPQSVEVGDSSGLQIGGIVIVAAGSGGGELSEEVVVTAKADGTHFTGIFTRTHTNAVAVTQTYSFYYDIGYNDRNTVAA